MTSSPRVVAMIVLGVLSSAAIGGAVAVGGENAQLGIALAGVAGAGISAIAGVCPSTRLPVDHAGDGESNGRAPHQR